MSIYGRPFDKRLKEQINTAVDNYIIIKDRKQSLKDKWFRFKRKEISICSQCKLAMDSHIAIQQIENKRENAPICIPCIVGIPRGRSKGGFLQKESFYRQL